jgi:DNA-binding HxlR family transcriptional regulator
MTDTVSQRFTYDWYEFAHGDGLFPDPVTDAKSEKGVIFKFVKEGSYWVQSSGDVITGLDGDFGIKTLTALNNKYKPDELQVATKMCMTRMKKQGMTDKVLSTPLNELSKEDFVFRVVDEMVNCEWKEQAEYIMSLVGHEKKPACTGVKNTYGKILYPK